MEVTFRTRKLEREYKESDKAIRAYGPQIGRKYISRINTIKQTKDIDEFTGIEMSPIKREPRWPICNKTNGFLQINIHS